MPKKVEMKTLPKTLIVEIYFCAARTVLLFDFFTPTLVGVVLFRRQPHLNDMVVAQLVINTPVQEPPVPLRCGGKDGVAVGIYIHPTLGGRFVQSRLKGCQSLSARQPSIYKLDILSVSTSDFFIRYQLYTI